MIHFQDNFYLTWNRNLVFILLFTWICHLDLSKHKLEHLVVLLAGPISHTSTQYIDFVDFYISVDLSTNYFAHLSGCWASFVCSCLSILECCVTFSGVKLSIRSFVLFMGGGGLVDPPY